MSETRRLCIWLLGAAAVAGLVVACSSDAGDDAVSAPSTGAPTTGDSSTSTTTAATSTSPSSTEAPAPAGPAAAVDGPLIGGDGIILAVAEPPDLGALGYEEEEYAVSGTASAYTGDTPADGRFALEPSETADYATRIVVRRPADEAAFSGTVIVEWLNVSGGLDAAPDWTYIEHEVVRRGHAWVGVSAQLIGIEGGPIAVTAPGAEDAGAGQGIVALDPERYGSLSHPGDAFSFDIFTQVGRALRAPGDVDPLDGLGADLVIAIGESQSASALSTYVNGVHPLAGVYDGYLIHSRPGPVFPLGVPGEALDIAGSLGGEPTPIRDDLDVPVMIVQAENDVIGPLSYYGARQDDSEHIRLWEMAGTAHADKQQIGDTEEVLGCPTPVNRGQMGFVVAAALDHLITWASGGPEPPEAPRLSVDDSAGQPVYERDEDGIVVGGIRTPVVEAPVDLLTGEPAPDSSIICILFGQTLPLPDERLAQLYDGPDDYLAAYEAATDAAIDAGFMLADDRDAILDGAQPDRIPAR